MNDVRPMARSACEMFRPLRNRLDVLRRHVLDDQRLFALNHRPHRRRGEPRSGGICSRTAHSAALAGSALATLIRLELPMLVHHVDATPVGDMLNDQPSQARQRLLVVERRRQHDARLSQELLFLFDPSSLGDVLRDTEQIQRVTRGVEDRHFLRVQDANALDAAFVSVLPVCRRSCRFSASRDLFRRRIRPVPVAKNRSRFCR